MNLRIAITSCLSVVLFTGCSDSSDKIATPEQQPQTLTLLVTNDDGIGAPGIDALVNGLLELDDVEVDACLGLSTQEQ